jgi:hypothetical protein
MFATSSIESIEVQKPLFPVYLKVFVNHFHMIGIILAISFTWPDTIDVWMDIQKKASSFSSFSFSIECFFIGVT